MDVTVEYAMKEDVIDVNDVRGGVRIRIDDESIVTVVDDEVESNFEWRPQYVGEYLHSDLSGLVMQARQISEGEVGVYQVAKLAFSPSKERFLFESLSEDALRVAYRIKQTSNISDDLPPLAVPESACGYVVDRCEFCRAVSNAAHEYVDELRSIPLEWGIDLLEEFEEKLAALDEAVETCPETPPKLDQDKQSPIEPPWES